MGEPALCVKGNHYERFFSMIKSLAKGLLLPVGSLSKELATYDPVDKPILYYESLLFWIALIVSLLGKAIIKLGVLEMYWTFLLVTILLLLATVMLISLFNLLIPPRFSASRLAIVVISIIMVLMLLSKN